MKIPYIVKETTATTQYRTTQPADKKYVMNELRTIVDLGDTTSKSTDPMLKQISHKLKTPNKHIKRKSAKYGGGMNSIYSAAEGIVSNIEDGTQRDFSNHTCTLIEQLTKEMQNVIAGYEEITFEEVPSFTTGNIKEEEITGGTFADLFDVESITITKTYKRKR